MQDKSGQSVRTMLIAILLLLTLIIVGTYYWVDQAQELSRKEAGVAAEFDKAYQGEDWTLTNLNGESVTLSDYQGRPVLLVFWATWCPYCKKLLPGIAELNDAYESKGLKVIAVNIKEDWKPDVYWRNHEYQFDAVLEGDEVAKIYDAKVTPTLVFIEPSGNVLAVQSFSDPKHPSLVAFAEEYTRVPN